MPFAEVHESGYMALFCRADHAEQCHDHAEQCRLLGPNRKTFAYFETYRF
jgi:hypothetical protein